MTFSLRERAELAEFLRQAVETDVDVAGMTGGAYGAATYFAGGKVEGVLVREELSPPVVELHLVVRNPRVIEVGDRVGATVTRLLIARGFPASVRVIVEDVDLTYTGPMQAGSLWQ